MAIQTSIDGYRLIADRTGLYAGSDDPVYSKEADTWDHPSKASVTVWKLVGGQRCPFTASARWSEYCPKDDKDSFMWKKMPYLMLGKCAEALALRKGFPAELSGIYTDDEMQQANQGSEAAEPTAAKKAAAALPLVEVETVPEPPKKAPKHVPTATEVMEHLTAAKFLQPLGAVYEAACKYPWDAADRESINECFLNCYGRLSNWPLRQGTSAFVTDSGAVLARIDRDPAGCLRVVEQVTAPEPLPNAEPPTPAPSVLRSVFGDGAPSAADAEMAAAEREGMKAA
jgi:hypothetical protein